MNSQAVSSGRKSGRLLKLLLILLVLLIIGGGVAWYQNIGRFRWSEPYKVVLAAVQKDSAVTGELGLPLKDASFAPSCNLEETKASIRFKVAGPKGEGEVAAEDMKKLNGKWVGNVVVQIGQRKIIVEVGDASDDAPKFPGRAPTATGGPGPGPGPTPPTFSSDGKAAAPPAKGETIEIDMPDLPDTPPAKTAPKAK